MELETENIEAEAAATEAASAERDARMGAFEEEVATELD